MFGTYLKQSWRTLPFIVIIPVLVCVLYITVVDPYGAIIIEGLDSSHSVDKTWEFEETQTTFLGFDDHKGFQRIRISMLTAIVSNILFLLIIPCAIGGADSGKKRVQFYLGFFANLALSIALPVYFIMAFLLASKMQLLVLISLHLAGFVLPFVLGALFVSPAYSRAFWFCNRR